MEKQVSEGISFGGKEGTGNRDKVRVGVYRELHVDDESTREYI